MRKTLFIKYNKTRRKKFQISTAICQDENGFVVEKRPLNQEAYKHINELQSNFEILEPVYTKIKFLKPQINYNVASFNYVSGKTLEQELQVYLDDLESLIAEIKRKIDDIFQISSSYITDFYVSEEYINMFGTNYNYNGKAVTVANIDMLFDNIIEIKGDSYCLDYEWVFKFPVPIDFLVYRCLTYFYNKYSYKIKKYCTREQFLNKFEIYTVDLFDSMETNFQKYVHGNDLEWIYTSNYIKETETLDELTSYEEEALRSRSRIIQLQNEEEERNEHLHKLDEEIEVLRSEVKNCYNQLDIAHKEQASSVIYTNELHQKIKSMEKEQKEQLKKIREIKEQEIEKRDNDIAFLNDLVHSKERIIDDQTLLIQNKDRYICDLELYTQKIQNSLFYKIAKLPKKILSKIFPRDSRRRKILGYCKHALIHPINFVNASSDSKNRILGDILIGRGYLEKGKAIFKYEENPLVSIIIPVYNQVTYTYNCLHSIIENTKDVSYEIIIADDVSSDATKHLKKLAENVTIIRNNRNMGFLKNCNNAAEKARGKYILFLNNDTQVNDNWLSSLIVLIESDSKIGMVGSKLVYPDGRLQEAGGIIWSDGSGWNYGRMDDPNKPEYCYVKDVDYISGASLMIKKDLWQQIGGFDERYAPAYCEDSDLAFQVRDLGYRVVFQPLSIVTHYEGISNGTDVSQGIKQYQVENSVKFRNKWNKELEGQPEGPDSLFYARDRSNHKKTILVIDHYVPMYDRDAGSRTTYQYIKMFLQKGFNVKFIGDNYYPMQPYTSQLEQLGVEVLYGTWYAQNIFEWIGNNKKFIDFAYVTRPHIVIKYIDFLRDQTNIKIMYYGCDLAALRLRREYELTNQEEIREEAESWEEKEFYIMKKADVSYYPSYVEVDYIKGIDPTIHVKPFNIFAYDEFKKDLPLNFKDRKGLMFVGGFAHGPNIDAAIWFVTQVYPLIREKEKIPFYIVGSNPTDEVKALANDDIIVTGFVSDEELDRIYSNCKMAVVPLRYGAGVKGKVIEALYNGMPLVTTSIGAEGIVGASKVMEIVDGEREFAQSILRLYHRNDLLEKMSVNTQAFVKKYFSMEAVWESVGEDFR